MTVTKTCYSFFSFRFGTWYFCWPVDHLYLNFIKKRRV